MLIVYLDMEEKPERCEDCLLRVTTSSGYYCAADKERRDLSYDSWRPYWCKLKEERELDER